MKVEQTDSNFLIVEEEFKGKTTFEYFFPGDVHFDSPHCKRILLSQHLKEAVEKKAGAIIPGDFFDAMQGRKDPRGTKADTVDNLLTEAMLNGGKNPIPYWQALVQIAADWLAPRIKGLPWVMFGYGNHESSVWKNAEFDLIHGLVEALKARGLTNVYSGGYGGYVLLRYRKSSNARSTQAVRIKYFHGKETGQVTKGVLGTIRRAAIYPDADLTLTGHTHESTYVAHPVERITRNGNVQLTPGAHLQAPTYKDEWLNGAGGFAVERLTPKPLGGWWIRVKLRLSDQVIQRCVTAEPTDFWM